MTSYRRVPVVTVLVLLLLAAPLTSMSMVAQGTGQACQLLDAPGPDSSGWGGDVRTFSNEVTLSNGAVIGYQDYWTGEIDPDTGYFSADSGDGSFLAGGYPAGVPLGSVWSELCSMLSMMGTVIDQGLDGGGGIYALLIVPQNDGSERHMLVRVVYASGTDVPVFGSLSAPADTFFISLGEADGLGINGQRVFDEFDLDHEMILATLAAGAPTGDGNGTTTTQIPAPTEAPQTQPSGTTVSAGELTSVNGTVFAYSTEWTPDPSMGEGPDGLTLLSGDTMLGVMDLEHDPGPEAIFEENFGDFPNIIDQGPTPDGGYYALAWGQTNAGQWMHVIFRTMHAPGTSTPVVVILAGPEGSLDQMLVSAQGVTANGMPVLDGLDPAATHATFEADGPTGQRIFIGGDAASTEATGSGSEGSTESTSASWREIITTVPALPDANERSESRSDTEDSYTSDLFGYTVAWERPWIPDTDSSEVNEDEGYDYVSLSIDETDGAMASILGSTWDDDYRADDYIDYWASDDYVEENFPEGTEVVLADGRRSSGAVVYVGPLAGEDSGSWVVIYEIVIMDDDLQIEPSFAAPLSDFEASYEAAIGSITVNGDSVFGYFPVDEILEALAQEE